MSSIVKPSTVVLPTPTNSQGHVDTEVTENDLFPQESDTLIELLDHFRNELLRHKAEQLFRKPLKFCYPPEEASPPPTTDSLNEAPLTVNCGELALVYTFPDNAPILGFEEWLLECMIAADKARKHLKSTVRLKAISLKRSLLAAYHDLQLGKREEWMRQKLDLSSKTGSWITDTEKLATKSIETESDEDGSGSEEFGDTESEDISGEGTDSDEWTDEESVTAEDEDEGDPEGNSETVTVDTGV
ncbi:hypothetical protein CONPUDRAFT_156783 [Coniophora puteana RWD-64-598 SS2]|uniref:Uncharacterized protein n=1 Tax=Coniophora puteana (strain RWD-64-598) TaxID=741705 RepID=A0A5M3MFL9_CONPW|nr:uncharacterized protein CONPUDRAFT_156783 [Coniophora puteana RWD-64-598 SS2]EIW77574.1 hypothetical protein CONPUDRAFT_156783 [Coniophora puteana RWD-64-598 SS2]